MKHLENFKSEYIQGIYDFLEQDADVTNFKRDLISVTKYKKVSLQDLEAELYQYADLMKEDLKDKITFVFREDGYLGMFGAEMGEWVKVERTEEAYNELRTGDRISVNIVGKIIYGILYYEKEINYNDIYIIQDSLDGSCQDAHDWKKYGRYSWCIYITGDIENIHKGGRRHSELKKYNSLISNLIISEKEIKELKETMHFALVI